MKSLFGRFRFLLVFGTGLLTLAFPPSFSKAQDRAPVQVMTSIFPLREFAKAVGGERAEVQQLLPPGAEAHAWEPKPSAVAKISKADIFVYIGPSMEPWAHKVIKAVQGKNLIVAEASRGLPFVEAEHGEGGKESHSHRHGHSHKEKVDPHIWLDFSLDLKIVDAILSAFVKKDPKQASYI
jgi:zinc transport system substrate-binding protein